jgi:hypothetical protein
MWSAGAMENWSDGVMERQRRFALVCRKKPAEKPQRVLDLHNTTAL